MNLIHIQWFNVFIIAFLGILLTAFHFGSKSKRTNAPKVITAGLACSLFGLGAACLRGKDCYDVLMLINASGFGRAYVFGLGILLAGIAISLIGFFTKDTRGKKD